MMKNFDQITTATQSRIVVLDWAASNGCATHAARARKHVMVPAFAGTPGTTVWSPPTG